MKIQRWEGQDLRTLPILPRSQNKNLPLSFAQQRLWFLDQLLSNTPINNIPLAYRVTGWLNAAVLEQSLNEIVRRHEVLRTTFPSVEGKPIQVIASEIDLRLPVVDLRRIAEAKRESEIQKLATEEARKPFDLFQAPLLRVKLLRLDEAEHVLFLTVHHIVSDSGSLHVMMQELVVLYEAFSSGKSTSLPELGIQYTDFAIWQRERLSEGALEFQLAYWKQKLGGELPVLELPTNGPRPPIQTYRGARQSFTLSKDLTDALRTLSQREEVSLFMTLLAAFKVLLYRYTSQEDVMVGSAIANRNRTEIEELIGCFTSFLVMRTDLSGTPSFRELLGRVREEALGAYDRQDIPFEKLVEELQTERDMSRNPLFQVMFDFQNSLMPVWEIAGLSLSPMVVDNRTAKFDLTLSLEDTEQGLVGVFIYNTDLFDEATIVRMVGHLQTLLAGVVADPDKHIYELPILTEAEWHQLLVEWNDTEVDFPKDKCIHQLFEEQVERTPDAVAIVFEDRELTYRDLNIRANQLAHYLQKLGVGPEVLVGICLERSPLMVVGLLGILKAGAAYVPLDPEYPKERLVLMLEDAQVQVLLTQQKLVEVFPQYKAQVVCLDADWSILAKEPKENPVGQVKSNNLVYVIYTSGSTGMPKGVSMQHLPLVNLIFWQLQSTNVSDSAKTLQFSPISFDVSFQEIFSTLCSGGTLVLIKEELRRDPVALLRLLKDREVERSFLPFVALQQLAETANNSNLIPSHLREIITAGEQLQIVPAISRLFGKLPGCTLHNHYGPSESHVVTTYTLSNSVESWSLLPPIGRPIFNTQIYILDNYQQPVPVGVAGNLHIGGVGLARGYLNRPDLTEEKFVPHPFSQEPGARLYKTGDSVHYLPDGNIEFLGRIDHQVKIRGYRVELGEVESILAQNPNVREVVVIAREHVPNAKHLIAYVVPNELSSIPNPKSQIPNQLRQFLKEKLPDYMVPSVIELLGKLPQTPSGKVDRRALPAPSQTRLESEESFIFPRDELELKLTRIWEEVLGIQPIGTRDNFFDLGGHSLLAIRLLAQIEKNLQANLSLSAIFQAPTIEDLSRVLRSQLELSPWYSLVPIQPRGFRPPLFTIHFTNLRDLYHHLEPEQPIYGLHYGMAEPMGSVLYLPKVEDLAAHYIEELRMVQLEGPYFLMGASFGGIVAYEMAQQLIAQGQKVTIALFDTYIEDGAKLLPLQKRISNIWRLGLPNFLRKAKNKVIMKFYRSSPQYIPQTYTEDPINSVIKAYTPKTYSGRVLLFKAMIPIQIPSVNYRLDWDPPEVGWRKFVVGELEIHEVPGGHLSILEEPYVQVLAEKLRACIDKARADDSGVCHP